MLDIMRKKAGSWIIKILLGIIILVFVFWGVGSFRDKSQNWVASVDGETISYEEYQDAYNNLLEQLRMKFGSTLNDDMIKMFKVKHQALNRLIDQKILINEAKRLRLRVSNEEVVNEIRKISAFHTAEHFDPGLYKKILNRARLTLEGFELRQKNVMILAKLKQVITGGIKVSELEAREWYDWTNRSVKIDYVVFKPEKYKDISVSDKEIDEYFNIHKESYKTEPEIQARYLVFDPGTYKSSVSISDKKLLEYYEALPEEFIKPATVHAKHILIKTEQNDNPEEVEEKRKKALDIFKMIKQGQNFKTLAKKFSQCPSKDNGGDLGTFKKKDMVPAFANKAFSMKTGELSEPVLTQFGWHIIKVEKANKEAVTSFKDAKDKIYNKLSEEIAANLAYDDAQSVYDISFEGDDLVNAANEHNIKIHTTEFFTKNQPVKGVAEPSKFAKLAFSLQLLEISDIGDFGDGYYIIQVVEKKPAKVPELAKVKERVKTDLLIEKKDAAAKDDADKFLTGLKNGKLMEQECKTYGLSNNETVFFKRDDTSVKSGLEKKVSNASFLLSKGKKIPENIIKGQQGYYVIRFKEKKEPDPGLFKEKEIKDMVLQEKNWRFFDSWLSGVRERSEIIIEKRFLEGV